MMIRLIALLLFVSPAVAAERIPGPVEAMVSRVVDGDTIKVEALVWIGQSLATAVRIRGIDAPELRGKCETEKRLAFKARGALMRILPRGSVVELTNIVNGKYAGRVVADVRPLGGEGVRWAMVAAGLARRYGGGARQGWCE